MSALVRITQGIVQRHSRVGFTRAMSQFGEVIHCHKPPFSGIPGEDFVNVRFASQSAADAAYAALKSGQVVVDGFPVGLGPTNAPAPVGMTDQRGHPSLEGVQESRVQIHDRAGPAPRRGPANYRPSRRSPEPPPRHFPSRDDPKSPSPRRIAREANMNSRGGGRSRSRPRARASRSRSRARRREGRRFREGEPARAIAFGAWEDGNGRPIRHDRTPSPDPPGPERNFTLVRNPFYVSAH